MFKNTMRNAAYLLVFLALLAWGPAAHATTYLSHYSGGSGYLSEYPSGGYSIGNSSGYIRGSLTSGAGSIDRTGASRPPVILLQPAASHAPCGIYNRAPVTPCRMVTMAYDPNASVSRTRGGLSVKPLSQLPPYFRSTLPNMFSNIQVQGRDGTE